MLKLLAKRGFGGRIRILKRAQGSQGKIRILRRPEESQIIPTHSVPEYNFIEDDDENQDRMQNLQAKRELDGRIRMLGKRSQGVIRILNRPEESHGKIKI